jgi:nitroreductase
MSDMIYDDGLECRGRPLKSSNISFINNPEWRCVLNDFGNTIRGSTVINEHTSSYEHYKVIAVRNSELKKQLRIISCDQTRITECETLFIFCVSANQNKSAEKHLWDTGREFMSNILTNFTSIFSDNIIHFGLGFGLDTWTAQQAYIALGFGLDACNDLKIKSYPVKGFTASEAHTILGLPDNMIPCLMMAAGSSVENNSTWSPLRYEYCDSIEERI